jgi:hypothetical protein
MKRLISSLLFLAVLALVLPAAAQEKSPEMQMYHVVLAKKGPNWQSMHSKEGMDIRAQVVENVKKAAREGLIVSAGLVNDETDVEFIFILNVETKHEALEILNQAPNVKNGVFAGEVYSWFATKIN